MDLHVYRNSQDRWHDLRSAARTKGAALATNAVTLDELVQRLTPDLKPASPAQRLVLVGRADPPSMRHAYEAVRDLKAGRVRGSDLRAAGADRLAEILDVYNHGLNAAGLVDPQDRRWIAAKRVAEGHPWIQRFSRVVIHAIYDLTECEFALIHNLIEALPDGGAVLLFNTTANIKPTQFAEWTWQRFIRDESLAEKTVPEFCRPSGPAAELLERLFVWDERAAERDGESGEIRNPESEAQINSAPVRVVQARGRYSEVEAIGSDIAELLDHGADANEIAVVVRRIEMYGELIEDVFSRYRIPHAFETGVPLIRIPFIKYWIALLDLVSSDRSRDAMIRVMSSAYFEPRLTPAIDVARLLIDIGYIDRNHLKASLLAARVNSPLTAELERIEGFLDAAERATERPAEFMARLQPAKGLLDRDRQAWRTLSEELEAVDALVGACPFATFRRIASEIAGLRTIDRFSGRLIAPGIPRVRIMPPSALGSRSYRWVFAPGFVDGEIPGRAHPNPLLPDETVDRLNQQTRSKRLLTSRDRNRVEPLYLFMILDTASDAATLSLFGSTLEGEPIYPSIYIAEIERHCGPGLVQNAPAETRRFRDPGEYARQAADLWRRDHISEAHAQALLGPDVVRRALFEGRRDGRADVGAGAIPLDAIFSPSELNSLAMCPFVFLAKHRLRLRAQELPDFEAPPAEVGNLAHRVLREFYSEPIPDSETAALTRMQEIIRRKLAAVDINGQGPTLVIDPALWSIRRPQLVSALHEYVKFAVRDARDGYETLPEYLDQPLPASELGGVRLAGRPDHVAIRRSNGELTGIRIDDFKYSAASSATLRQLKQSFQIPVYAFLAAKALDARPGTPVEGRYLLLRSPSSPVVSQPIDEPLWDEVAGRIEQLLHRVQSGRLRPAPADKQECTGCDYRRLCRLYG